MRILIPAGPMQTTAIFAKLALVAATIKTLLQVKPSATNPIKVVEWGISFDASVAGAPGVVELIETDVAATVTASASADLTKVDGEALVAGDPTTNLIVVGTAATGYNATVEGTITAIRNLDGPQLIAPTNQFIKQFPLGSEPIVQPSKFLRIRANMPAGVNCLSYVVIEV